MAGSVFLIGYPLKHSISPVFQQAAFDYYSLDIRYEKCETQTAQLPEVVSRLRQASVFGANVTVPHKEKVIPLLDEVDNLASRIGAVNTVVNRKGKLIGYNTDALAFVKALREDAGFYPCNKNVALLGAGGAARAVIFALMEESVKSITVFNRTPGRGVDLVASVASAAQSTKLSALPWQRLVHNGVLEECDLLVNCTSVGMRYSEADGESPLMAAMIPKRALVYDLVYNPEETPLLKEAKKAGAQTLGGLSMLVYQGAASFELWVCKRAPLDIMMKYAREALR